VNLFEELRRELTFGIGTVRGVAGKFHVHRRVVRQALESSVPPDRKVVVRPSPALDPVKRFIEDILTADQTAPRKQRHTAHRIWVRLRSEMSEHPVAESTVRAYVRERKGALGLTGREVYVPQEYELGYEAQADWYEAWVVLDGVRVKVQVFSLRSMMSGGAYHRAYYRATQQAFFEAHEEAFKYFGGVFQVIRYDNLASAVKKVLKGHTRQEHERFIEFRSHWRFNSEFCAPRQPQEKGGVEGEAGTYRRNHFVPVPEAKDLDELNLMLQASCTLDQSRVIGSRTSPVGELMIEESTNLTPLPIEGFDIAQSKSPTVDGKGCVKLVNVWYSTPLRPGTRVTARLLPSLVEVWYAGKLVARHERCYTHGQEIYDLNHYLDVLDRKPGALPGSKPLAQWRAAGRWPRSLDTLHELWQKQLGRHEGTRELVDLILLAPKYGWSAIRSSADSALEYGCTDASAVKCLLTQSGQPTQMTLLSLEDLGVLSKFDRSLPVMDGYDLLLAGSRSGAMAVTP
jgi:transposase